MRNGLHVFLALSFGTAGAGCALSGSAFEVIIKDQDGAPIVGARVYPVTPSLNGPARLTDDAGKTTMPRNQIQNVQWVSVEAEGFGSRQVSVPGDGVLRVTLSRGETSGKLVIEIVHGPSTGEACPTFERGEICREFSHWFLKIRDQTYRDWDGPKPFLQREADQHREASNPQVSTLKVQIRAGAQVPYPLAQRTMNLCAKCGIYKIEVGPASR